MRLRWGNVIFTLSHAMDSRIDFRRTSLILLTATLGSSSCGEPENVPVLYVISGEASVAQADLERNRWLNTNRPRADLVIRSEPVSPLAARCELPSAGGDNKVFSVINVRGVIASIPFPIRADLSDDGQAVALTDTIPYTLRVYDRNGNLATGTTTLGVPSRLCPDGVLPGNSNRCIREVVCPNDRPCLSGFFEPVDIRLDDFSTPCPE